MVLLKPYNFTHFQPLNYELDEVQTQYTATVPAAISRIEQRHLKGDFLGHPITIFFSNRPVGFFVLDFGPDKFELSDSHNSVLLRSLSINPKFQGKGIGKVAMMAIPNYISQNFPGTMQIVLAVNEQNFGAKRLYEKCDYRFSEKTREGRSGLQRIMYKNL